MQNLPENKNASRKEQALAHRRKVIKTGSSLLADKTISSD